MTTIHLITAIHQIAFPPSHIPPYSSVVPPSPTAITHPAIQYSASVTADGAALFLRISTNYGRNMRGHPSPARTEVHIYPCNMVLSKCSLYSNCDGRYPLKHSYIVLNIYCVHKYSYI